MYVPVHALGHPWGASGALLVTRLFSSLVRRYSAARSVRSSGLTARMRTMAPSAVRASWPWSVVIVST